MREEEINVDESPEELEYDSTKPPLTDKELEMIQEGF